MKELRDNIKNRVNLEMMAAGYNKKRIVQAAVFEELVEMLTPARKPFVVRACIMSHFALSSYSHFAPLSQPKKGKQSVIMFVGLQGSGKTTSCTKFASYYKSKGFKVALICAGHFLNFSGVSSSFRVVFAYPISRFYGSAP